MKKKCFIAIDTTNLKKAKRIIALSKTNKLKIGYKFGLEFMNSKGGRLFVSKLRNKIIFIDLKLNDTVNTMLSAVKALKDLKINYLTVHISSGLTALKAVKKISQCKIVGVSTLTSLNNKDLKRVSSGYGTRIDPFLKVKRMHYGQDFSLPKGSPVYATADGRVSILKSSFGGFGKYIYIDHGNGYKTVYAHLDKFNVRRGQKVKRGELIAYSGNSGRSTAPHLHYEVHKNGKKVNPINFFFNDLTPNEYEEVIKLASVENQALGSTF